MAEKRHPGITMHQLSFGGGFMGLLFALGSGLIFVLGFPTLWYFVALALALGIGIAALLRLLNQSRSDRNKPLSIVSLNATEVRKSPERMKWRRSFKIRPAPTAA